MRLLILLSLGIGLTHACTMQMHSPFAAYNKDQWTYEAASELCIYDYFINLHGQGKSWGGEFCTFPANDTDYQQVKHIFVTKWFCASECAKVLTSSQVKTEIEYSCDQSANSIDSADQNEVTVECKCGDTSTDAFTFQQVHDAFTSECLDKPPKSLCSNVTAPDGVVHTSNDGFHASAISGESIAGTTLTAHCADPSMVPNPESPTTTTCQPSGEWTVYPFETECANMCHSLDDLNIVGEQANSTWDYSVTPVGGQLAVGATATKHCEVGYALESDLTVMNVTMQCGLGGWTPATPCCVPISARQCGLVEFGAKVKATADSSTASGSHYGVGDVITLECLDEEEVLQDDKPHSAVCLRTGKWSADVNNVTCVASIACAAMNITNMDGLLATYTPTETVGEPIRVNTVLTIACTEMFYHVDPAVSISRCRPDGTWTVNFTNSVCVPDAQCGPITLTDEDVQQKVDLSFADGESASTIGSFLPGSVVTAESCADPTETLEQLGKQLSTLTGVCLADGHWSNTFDNVTCAKTCHKLNDDVAHKEVNQTWDYLDSQGTTLDPSVDRVPNGGEARMQCATGYGTIDEDTTQIVKECIDGHWTTEIAPCNKLCKIPEPVNGTEFLNGEITSLHEGVTLNWLCISPDQRPSPTSEQFATCLSNGSWSASFENSSCVTTCLSIDTVPANVDPSAPTWNYTTVGHEKHFALDTEAHIACANGFVTAERKSKIVLTCTADGWTPDMPNCLGSNEVSNCPADDEFELVYRSVDFALPAEHKPSNDSISDVTENECLMACRENRVANGVAYRPCESAEYHTVSNKCYLFDALPGIQEEMGDGTNETKLNQGKSYLTATPNTVFFEKACVEEKVFDNAICNEGIIEKRPTLEGYTGVTGGIHRHLTIGRCFAKCIEHNEQDGITPESRCILASFEYMERRAYDPTIDDPSDGIIDGGSTSSVVRIRVIDPNTTFCRLYKWTGSKEHPEDPSKARLSDDKYYNPATDPWRVGRWFSLLVPQCSISTKCPNPNIVKKLDVYGIHREISDGSLDYDEWFPVGTKIRIYCIDGKHVAGTEKTDAYCDSRGQWSEDLSIATGCEADVTVTSCRTMDHVPVANTGGNKWTYTTTMLTNDMLALTTTATIQCANGYGSSEDQGSSVRVQCLQGVDDIVPAWTTLHTCIEVDATTAGPTTTVTVEDTTTAEDTTTVAETTTAAETTAATTDSGLSCGAVPECNITTPDRYMYSLTDNTLHIEGLTLKATLSIMFYFCQCNIQFTQGYPDCATAVFDSQVGCLIYTNTLAECMAAGECTTTSSSSYFNNENTCLQTSKASHYFKVEKTAYDGTVICKQPVTTTDHCLRLCEQHPTCRTAQFHLLTGECELLSSMHGTGALRISSDPEYFVIDFTTLDGARKL